MPAGTDRREERAGPSTAIPGNSAPGVPNLGGITLRRRDSSPRVGPESKRLDRATAVRPSYRVVLSSTPSPSRGYTVPKKMFEWAVGEIEAAYARLGHQLGWRFLMSPRRTFARGV